MCKNTKPCNCLMGVLTEEKQIHHKAVHHSIICFTDTQLCHALFPTLCTWINIKDVVSYALVDELSETFVVGKLVVELLDISCLCPTLDYVIWEKQRICQIFHLYLLYIVFQRQ